MTSIWMVARRVRRRANRGAARNGGPAQGTRVVIASRRETAAKTALKTLTAVGDAEWVPVDVTDGKSVAGLIDMVVSTHGRLEYAFNNGGTGGTSAPVAKMFEAAWRKTIDGYLSSVFLCMNAEIAAMQGIAASAIVNNASVDGLRGYPFVCGAAYSAAKHGVIGLTRSAALSTRRAVLASARCAPAGSKRRP